MSIQILLSLVTALTTGLIGYLFHKLKQREEKREAQAQKQAQTLLLREKATNDALRALCHDRILQGYRYYKRRDGLSAQDLETMTKLYHAYHGLGGNGTITAVYDKICQLPIKEGV